MIKSLNFSLNNTKTDTARKYTPLHTIHFQRGFERNFPFPKHTWNKIIELLLDRIDIESNGLHIYSPKYF